MSTTAAIDAVACSVHRVPTPAPEADGTLQWDATTVVTATVRAGGQQGLGWTYGHTAVAPVIDTLIADTIQGQDALAVPRCHTLMTIAARNALVPGLVTMAISAVDVALWDLKAKLLDTPLVDLFGRAENSVSLYGSGGFTTLDDNQLQHQLSEWTMDDGMTAVKIKIGEGFGRNIDRDLHRVDVARAAVGPTVALMVDANGGYQAKQAMRVADHLADRGVDWFEEPVSSDHLDQLAAIRQRITPEVTAGEYGTSAGYFRRMCQAGAVDCLQVDATRCGGYTGFLAAAAVAQSFGLQVSAHCAPNLHASVCAAVTNLRHVEWFADHVRADETLFDGTSRPHQGRLAVQRDRPGHGLRLLP